MVGPFARPIWVPPKNESCQSSLAFEVQVADKKQCSAVQGSAGVELCPADEDAQSGQRLNSRE
eukprot:3710918-Pyramimonas_sp.AAC.1